MVIGVRVLGPLEVTVDGVPVSAGGPRQRCVLARLVAAHGRVVSADRLIEDLYAGEAPPRALAAVQSYVSHLRRALEPGRAAWDRAGVLAASPPGYALRLGPDAVDAWAFEDEVHQATGLDDAAAVHARLSAALAAWRGAAFQEFGGLGWADLEASRLEELRLAATEKCAEAALRLGRAAQIVAGLDQLTSEQPLREEAWRLLALALYQSGRQGDALAALRRARARLAEELGVDPGPALRELESDILAQAPHLAVPAATTPYPAPAGSPVAPRDDDAFPVVAAYVGRDAELSQALDAAAEAAAGRLRIMLVTGDAGAGKTALADWLSQRLQAQGWTVAAGRCPEYEGAPAGWPWAEALRGVARADPPAEPQALDALLTDTAAADGDMAAARFRLHQAVSRYLAAVSRDAPLLVVLDDLHRADSETLAILIDIVAGLTTSRVLLLASYRPAETGERLSECLAALAAREPVRVTLHGLDATATGELIQAICSRAVSPATTLAIAERTGGNPFFIKETARLLDSEGEAAAATEVPAGVREVLHRRIGRLPATAQTVLRQAAVIGAETDADVLGDVAGISEHTLLDAVEAGLLSGLLTEPAAGRIRFAHDLIRDTLYHSLSRLRRSRLHARAAQAIEHHHPAAVAALAYHYSEARNDPVKAARYCRLAAQQAEQRFGYHEAARLWEQAIACLDAVSGAPAEDRLELMLGLVSALANAGQLARARSLRKDAIRAALPLDDPELLARVIAAFDVPRGWFSHEYSQEYGTTDHELVATVEQTLASLAPHDGLLRCRLLTTLAFELEGAESERGYQASAEALEMARRLGDPGALTIAISGRFMQSFRHDGLAERQALGAELLALPGKPVTAEALAHLLLMMASSSAADFAAADRHADQAAHLAARYDLPATAAGVTLYRAFRTALDGGLAAAAELYQQAAAAVDRLGLGRQAVGMSILGRLCLLIMGDRVADIAGELEHLYSIPGADVVFAEAYALALAASGQAAQARVVAGPRHPISPDIVWVFRTSIRGLLAVAIEDRERAESAYQALLPFAGRPAGADAILPLWPVAQILGDLAGYLGLPEAQAHYRQALAIAERARVEPWRAAASRSLREREL
jgi:DNA-binding SARP family transcriptional activator